MRKALILFGIVTLVIAGYFLFPTIKDVVINTPTPTPDPYAGWNTYTNEEYGFSFMYPENWSITSEESVNGLYKTSISLESSYETLDDHPTIIGGYLETISFYSNENPTLSSKEVEDAISEIIEFGNNRSNMEQGVFDEISIAGTTGIKARSIGLELEKYIEIYVPHVSKGYVLEVYYPSNELTTREGSTIADMLKTLRIY
ncbi:hypothetical protein COY32_03045 [candidate division WWE3 bacterium CG_4_10_14_0_2_um_filter_41_14]|uniref:PsbP C-terminal domain-containing protein n=1 Tax=candidate division WWE3 bacterium CG_4_10_14_0_2_um_filter_41_14 TaxID=1975072 RepID=A0A2M7TJD3_UNCKA|nr:MAG: hypothetical protein COY32_03045 [candidate division WWE3 bacterium CG_4_10_14_0_2_um_filter_41_14]